MLTGPALVVALVVAGCASLPQRAPRSSTGVGEPGLVTYYDRNHDGRVDYEYHDVGCCDRNWALMDTDFDGRYDVMRRWGYGYSEAATDSPVPTGVLISSPDPATPPK